MRKASLSEELDGKTVAETMDDEQLLAYLNGQVARADEARAYRDGGSRCHGANLAPVVYGLILPNVEYLREIGRLPAEFADFDPEKLVA